MKTTTIRAMSFASHFLLAFVVVSALMTPAIGIAFWWGTKEAKTVVFAVHGTCLALWFIFSLIAWLYRKRLADDDKAGSPHSAWGRFYRFMSASSVKTETFPEGFDIRAFKRRRLMRLLATLVVVALVVWLFYFRIGLAILFAPLIVPMVALTLSCLSALGRMTTEKSYDGGNFGGILNLLLPCLCKSAPIRGGKLTDSCEFRLWTGRSPLAFAIAYLIVYAAYLISTPFRPMPLDPPPPELMAKIHPCLLDENGEIRKPETIIVDDFYTPEEEMYQITNNTSPQFKVLAAIVMDEHYAICDSEQKERRRLEDELVSRLRLSAETNMLSLADAGVSELMQAIRDGTENLIGIAEEAEQPQLGFDAIVPRYAESRREYVEFSVNCLPPLRQILMRTKARFDLDADKGEVLGFSNEIEIYASLRRAIDFHENLIDVLLIRLMDQHCLSGVMRMAELNELTTPDASEVEAAFRSMVGQRHSYEGTLRAAEREVFLEVDPPWSGDSFAKAVKSIILGNFNLICYRRPLSGRIPHADLAYGALKVIRWVPCLATWIGYDCNAQMEMLQNLRAWHNVELSTQLEHGYDMFEEWFPRAAFTHPFARGGLAYALWATLVHASHPAMLPILVQSFYADRHDMVADVVLRLSQFRGEKGRDAESLAEVEEALGWKPEADSDLEVFYEPLPAPEGAAEGTFAYALGLKPKTGCRKAFENTGDAWLVVRNPNFAGTLKRRFFHFEQYDDRRKLNWDRRVADKADSDALFALPRSLFCDDPAELEEAVGTLMAAGWSPP